MQIVTVSKDMLTYYKNSKHWRKTKNCKIASPKLQTVLMQQNVKM